MTGYFIPLLVIDPKISMWPIATGSLNTSSLLEVIFLRRVLAHLVYDTKNAAIIFLLSENEAVTWMT